MALKIIWFLIYLNFVASQQNSTESQDILVLEPNVTTSETPTTKVITITTPNTTTTEKPTTTTTQATTTTNITTTAYPTTVTSTATTNSTTNTTTSKPTTPTVTTIEPTNSTTKEPTSTTTESPTLPPPTLPPSPEAPKMPWNVTHPNGSVCILAEFAAQIKIKYNSSEKMKPQFTTGFNIPANASVDRNASVCSDNIQVLVLKFDIKNQTMGSIRFAFNKTKDTVFVQNLTLVYQLTEDLFPNYINKSDYNKTITVENDAFNREIAILFTVDDKHSYRCKAQSSVKLNNTRKSLATYGAELDIRDAKVQAFIPANTKSNGTYSPETECSADNKSTQVSSTVPIVVGAALAGLVAVVLIAFFIGKQRNRRAYTSV